MLSQGVSNDSSKKLFQRHENPLPWKQLSILLLLNLAEPISCNVIFPFIASLIEELGVAKEESSIGYYVGIVESLFFVSESLFIFQWGRLSDRIGRKPVLVLGLLGLALSMTAFGLSHSLFTVILSRVLAGALNGNIGVLKSAVGELADETNLARAFSFIPLIWFVGSTIGPMMGGYLSHPAERFPLLFRNTFWMENPYFLPCVTAAAFALVCGIIALLFLKETKPYTRPSVSKYHTFHSGNSEDTLFSSQSDQLETATLLGSPKPTDKLLPSSPPETATPLRDLLIKPVLLSVVNYGLLALLDISFQALFPIFLASSLRLSPSSIGFILGIMGLVNGLIQVIFFVPVHRRFGTRAILTVGICSFGFIFAVFPFIERSYIQNGHELGFSAYALIGVQIALCPIENMAFNVIFLYVQASSPSRETLGATNGIAQTAASIARAIGPVGATSLFAFSMNSKGAAGGTLVYWVLGAVTVIAAGVSRMLPAEPWEKTLDEE